MPETLPAKRQTYPLPKLDDLYGDIELASKLNDLNKLLNAPPKPEWVLINKFANNSKYLPIERVEYLLTTIFIKWRVEIQSCQVMANSVVTIVRLFVLNPLTAEWDYQDGVGASPIQTKQGAAATDFSQVSTLAVQMAAPASESMAFKDAAEKFGKLFGKDLNRKDEINYAPTLDSKFIDPNAPKEIIEIPEELRDAISLADIPNLNNIYHTNKEEYGNNKEFMTLLTARKNELRTSKTPA